MYWYGIFDWITHTNSNFMPGIYQILQTFYEVFMNLNYTREIVDHVLINYQHIHMHSMKSLNLKLH
jgi:hypothetical protein